MRLSELEFRVRQTESYIKYSDELTQLHKEKKSKKDHLTPRINELETKHSRLSERVSTLEERLRQSDGDLRQLL